MADTSTVRISDQPSNASPLDPPSRIICRVCQKQFSQYTCPRCNSRYCSLPCYKAHSLRCTESFMRENVVEELSQMQPNDETRRNMMEILKRFHSEEETDAMDEDEDDEVLSEETVQKILSGGSISLDDLSEKEKKRFQRAVASGELSKLIQPWDPWWLKPSARTISLGKDGTRLVQPLDHNSLSPHQDSSDRIKNNEVPLGPETPLAPVSKLISTEPSPLLVVHLVDILYGYCFTLRLYNGDWQCDVGSSMVVLSTSNVLGQGGQPETVTEALSYCLEQTCSSEYKHMGGLQFGVGLIEDVLSLLSLGNSALVCALCDLQRMIEAGRRDLKGEKLRKSGIKSKLKLAERKVYFMMCWVNEQSPEVWASLCTIVEAEKRKVVEYRNDRDLVRSKKKAEANSSVRIQEI